tara:strand:+ start:3960 stop:4877 length:918 start_codon:yes stop_codon:yes gene_type:complete
MQPSAMQQQRNQRAQLVQAHTSKIDGYKRTLPGSIGALRTADNKAMLDRASAAVDATLNDYQELTEQHAEVVDLYSLSEANRQSAEMALELNISKQTTEKQATQLEKANRKNKALVRLGIKTKTIGKHAPCRLKQQPRKTDTGMFLAREVTNPTGSDAAAATVVIRKAGNNRGKNVAYTGQDLVDLRSEASDAKITHATHEQLLCLQQTDKLRWDKEFARPFKETTTHVEDACKQDLEITKQKGPHPILYQSYYKQRINMDFIRRFMGIVPIDIEEGEPLLPINQNAPPRFPPSTPVWAGGTHEI